jgi:hypothetical protein
LADALVNCYELDWATLNIDPNDEADVMRILRSPSPQLLPPLEQALRLPLPAFILTIIAVKKGVREEVGKDTVLLLICKHLQQLTLAQQRRQAAASAAPPAAAAATMQTEDSQSFVKREFVDAAADEAMPDAAVSSLPPLERPQPLDLAQPTSSLLAAADDGPAGILAGKRRADAADLPSTPEPVEKRPRLFASVSAAAASGAAPVAPSSAASAVSSDIDATPPGSAASVASASSATRSPTPGDTGMIGGPASRLAGNSCKIVSPHPISLLRTTGAAADGGGLSMDKTAAVSAVHAETQEGERKSAAPHASSSPPPLAPLPILPLTAASVLSLLQSAPLRLEELCARLISPSSNPWTALPKVQALLRTLCQQRTIVQRAEQFALA